MQMNACMFGVTLNVWRYAADGECMAHEQVLHWVAQVSVTESYTSVFICAASWGIMLKSKDTKRPVHSDASTSPPPLIDLYDCD
jgi:hypothetical protein